jgi:hypothetical protein
VAAARPKARAAGGLAPLSAPEALAAVETPTGAFPRTEALGNVFRALLAHAEEIARRQGELEARQDAVPGKMTLLDEGSPNTGPGRPPLLLHLERGAPEQRAPRERLGQRGAEIRHAHPG